MELHHLGKNPSMLNQYVAELRDVNIQKDSMRFRQNIHRIGWHMAFELSKTLKYSQQEVQTPLATSLDYQLSEDLVLGGILRAALPFHDGFLQVFDKAENAFISAYRKHINSTDFEIEVEYVSSPDITGKTLVLVDPMLATGNSMLLALEALIESRGMPKEIHLISIIGSDEGVQKVLKKGPKFAHLWIAAIDHEMTAQSYIVPGLGDAGDLAYGIK